MLPKWKHRKTMLVLSFLMVSLYDMNEREVRSMALNDNIKKFREEKKYTQQQLADKLYVSRQTICRWENGSRCPDLITAKKLAMELGVTLDELISHEDITDIQSKYGIWKFYKRKGKNSGDSKKNLGFYRDCRRYIFSNFFVIKSSI